jgi:hypothetical protein
MTISRQSNIMPKIEATSMNVAASKTQGNATSPQAVAIEARRSFMTGLGYAAILSAFINVLQLTVPLYMLQVHDRVLNSRSMDTLAMLSVLAAGALILYGILDFIRSQVFLVMGGRLVRRLNGSVGLHPRVGAGRRRQGGPGASRSLGHPQLPDQSCRQRSAGGGLESDLSHRALHAASRVRNRRHRLCAHIDHIQRGYGYIHARTFERS